MKTLIALCIFAAATGARADGYGFRTPSGNIYCNGSLAGGAQGSSDISCSIVERGGPPAWPDPGSCPGVWGHHFDLGSTGPARVVCGTAPRKSTYTDVAPYGETGNFGDITCQSEKTGLTCRNRSGNGFFLSRRSQRVF